MSRRLLNLLTLLSLLLCVATLAVWLRSRGTSDRISYTPGPVRDGRMTQWVLRTDDGALRVEGRVVTAEIRGLRARLRSDNDLADWPATWPDTWSETPTPLLWDPVPLEAARMPPPLLGYLFRPRNEQVTERHDWHALGFAWQHDRRTQPAFAVSMDRYALTVPCWAIALATALPPAAVLLRHRRRSRRTAAGLCPACGYDLRATPGQCPECGHVPAPARV